MSYLSDYDHIIKDIGCGKILNRLTKLAIRPFRLEGGGHGHFILIDKGLEKKLISKRSPKTSGEAK